MKGRQRSSVQCPASSSTRVKLHPGRGNPLPTRPLVPADLEGSKESAASVFEREVAPLLAAHPSVWPPAACGAAAFGWACGMVGSRAFHLVKENWITAAKSEGGCAGS